MSAPAPQRPPTVAEAFFRTGFGCVAAVVVQIALIVVMVLVIDWRFREKAAREAAERACASETALQVVDLPARRGVPDCGAAISVP